MACLGCSLWWVAASAGRLHCTFTFASHSPTRPPAHPNPACPACRPACLPPPAVNRHQKTILGCLRDGDVSIRRRALDLLFTMCTPDNSADIVAELLSYLTLADFSMREELVLKTAVLAERCGGWVAGSLGGWLAGCRGGGGMGEGEVGWLSERQPVPACPTPAARLPACLLSHPSCPHFRSLYPACLIAPLAGSCPAWSGMWTACWP